jgi:outer membrane protein TolC
MRYAIFCMLLCCLAAPPVAAQDSLLLPEPRVVPLEDIVTEALARNPRVLASVEMISAANARVGQAGVPDPPELTYRRKEMPGFRWADAMSSEWELMQLVRFPSKYGTESRLGDIQSEHAHHEAEEIVNSVLLEVREAYAELWFVQQREVLEQENLRLTERLRDIATERYRVGSAARNDMLMAEMLRIGSVNAMIGLRQSELGVKARLSALLDRRPEDTLGYAVVTEVPSFETPLDTLLAIARRTRPMLIHDSLAVTEREEMASSARQTYLPDLRLGISYMDAEIDMFRGWTVSAGITLPFVPWNLGKAGAAVEEAERGIAQAGETFNSTRNKVLSDVKAAWYDVTGALRRLRNLGSTMLPAAEQALGSGLAAYEAGKADYFVVHQAYSAFIGAQTEYFSTRLEYEKALARLRLATGYNGLFQ